MRQFVLTSACAAVIALAPGCPANVAAVMEGEGEGAEGEGEGGFAPLRFVVDGRDVTDVGIDFGRVATGSSADRSVLVEATVDGDVAIWSEPPVLLGGRDVDMWSVTEQPAGSMNRAGSPLTLRFAPTIGGSLSATVVVAWGRRSDERLLLALTGESDGPQREPGLRTSIYDGTFDALPDFEALTPTTTQTQTSLSIDERVGTDFFAYRFVGAIEVPADGTWEFFSSSDDGSRVIVDGVVVVDNDGLHGPFEVSGGVDLVAGLHGFEVQFFEKGGGEVLDVAWRGPGIERQAIPDAVLFTAP